MKSNQVRYGKWLQLALHFIILFNILTCKSSFESLLKEYSKFKEKQIAKKARKLLGNHSSVKMTLKKKQKNRQLTDSKGSILYTNHLSKSSNTLFNNRSQD